VTRNHAFPNGDADRRERSERLRGGRAAADSSEAH
jgi:hypothetical protein